MQIYKGVRLIPLPSLNTEKITSEVIRYLPGFPFRAFVNQARTFFGKTLLVIDQSGFSIFHKPPERLFESGTRVGDLSFEVKEHDVKFRNSKEIRAFIKSFFQALSLVGNSSFENYHIGWFLAEDKSLHTQDQTISTRHPFLGRDRFGHSIIEVEKIQIDEAKGLYEILTKLNSKSKRKLQTAINRWIKSTTYQTPEDKIIDLVIAFEALYLPDAGESTFKFAVRASWHLGENRENRTKLFEVFKELYKCRSAVVHGGDLEKKQNVAIEGESVPISKFIARTQDLCRKSIVKIMKQCLKEGKFPTNDYWDDLILGEVDN